MPTALIDVRASYFDVNKDAWMESLASIMRVFSLRSRLPALRLSTDITHWFSENRPKTLAECADLERALKTKSKVGKNVVDVFGPKGKTVTHVSGPVGEVALKSVAARKLFNKRLAGIEQIIEVYLKQWCRREVGRN